MGTSPQNFWTRLKSAVKLLLQPQESSQIRPQKGNQVVKGMIISPTGKGIRHDPAGRGDYLAPRGSDIHRSLDFVCTPGQQVVCPINRCQAVRCADPFGDREYSGVLLRSNRIEILLFYLCIHEEVFGKTLFQGDIIGLAQDITKRYIDGPEDIDNKMQPHIHLQVDSIDPELLLKETYNA